MCSSDLDGRYARHVERVRARLDGLRDKTIRALERHGFKLPHVARGGSFLWADAGCDTNRIAAAAQAAGIVAAPGSLFSPSQGPSTFMRFNIATSQRAEVLALLARSRPG